MSSPSSLPPGGRSPASAQGRWLALYDDDCGFCKWGISGILAWDRRNLLTPCPLQSEKGDALLADLSPEQRLASWHLIAPDGRRFSGGEALAPLLRLLPAGRLPAIVLAAVPRLTNRAYGWVARNRSLLSKGVPASAKRRAGERVSRAEAERPRA